MTVEEKSKKEELNNDEVKKEVQNNVKSSEVLPNQEKTTLKKTVNKDVNSSKKKPKQKEKKLEDTNNELSVSDNKSSNQVSMESLPQNIEVSPDSKKVEEKKDSKKASSQQNTSENVDNKTLEPKNETQFEKSDIQNKKQVHTLGHQVIKLFQNLVFTFIAILILAFTVFTIANSDNSTISSGISILGVDVSKLDKDAATEKISNFIQESLENDIILKHNEYETNIGPEQIETKVKVSSAIDAAFDVGSGSNIFSNSFTKLSLLLKPVDIKPSMSINSEQLAKTLDDISTQLPDAVKQSDYYMDGNNLIITSGKSGVVVNTPAMANIITEKINNLSYINNPIEILTTAQDPKAPDIEAIYNEIHKDAVDAHYDGNTRVVYPEENGLDFKISLEEAKNMLATPQEEYNIPLKVLHPSITTNMIGMEAFPELLSSFSTKYTASNAGRTTNLRLAAGKIDGTVVLPGQTFSYNAVVGERTIAAGYKEAAVYQDGQVVNGLGGGICQISTTLYNAALYANLDILERRNHQFVPSYIGAGRDATVVYGSQDFKFKNTRNYAIKITCSVERGIATFNIYGIPEENEYEVVISSNVTSRNANSFTSATYKTLKQNGETVSSETISRDTYKIH